jgi:hypothetical protein
MIAQQRRHSQPQPRWDWGLWRRWVLANALGELVGLGAAAIVGVILARMIESAVGAFAGLAMAAVLIPLGTFEGVVVGLAQWRVLRRPFANMPWRAWTLASAAGAFIAWTLGMLPSTLIDAGVAGAGVQAEMSDLMMYSLAAAMGAVLGPILGVPQWLVLRRHVRRAVWWIPANAAAWALGMPVVFVGAGSAPAGGLVGIIATGVLTAAAAGAVVGAIHGLALVWLARQDSSLSSEEYR